MTTSPAARTWYPQTGHPATEFQSSLVISTDPARIDKPAVIQLLQQQAYWAREFSATVLEQSIDHSLCYSLLDGEKQAGFARLITDYVVFAYVEDVIIDEPYRGSGLGKWLMQCIMQHVDEMGINKLMLTTADAQGLYRQYGFHPLKHPDMVMEYFRSGVAPDY